MALSNAFVEKTLVYNKWEFKFGVSQMIKKEEIKLVASNNEVNYYITNTGESDRKYGIYAELKEDQIDNNCVLGIYFTEEEARLCCIWLCDNCVYPVSLKEVLQNIV